jgi:MinD-like ATPase involved in chromosome partitioning or flagellar assembly
MSGARDWAALVARSFLSSTNRDVDELDRTDAAVRAPVTTSRRLALVSLHGGTGTSTTAAAVAATTAHRRAGRVLAVDVAAGPAGLAARLGVPTDARRPLPSRVRSTARSSWEATEGLPVVADDLVVLGLGHGRDPDVAADSRDWAAEVAPIARFFEVVVADWGRRDPAVDLGAVCADAHAVAVVCRSDRASVEEAASYVDALRSSGRRPAVVVASVDVDRVGPAAADLVARRDGTAIVSVPFDSAKARADRPSGRELTASSRSAHAALAAALMTGALGDSAPAPIEEPRR